MTAAIRQQAFTVRHDGIVNRIVIPVNIFPAFDPAKPPVPMPPFFKTTALWDTGATSSVLTASTVKTLGLIPVGKTIVSHAGGASPSQTYMVMFGLPNNVMVTGVIVTECDDRAGDFGAIIGMDIIAAGDFALSHKGGRTCMTFRVPSMATHDYVLEINRERFRNVPRNRDCPCGSGKKFKLCHEIELGLA